MSYRRPIHRSFYYASDGIKEAFRNEPNFRAHIIVSIIVLVLGFFLGLTNLEWIVLFLTIAFVIVLELINTSIEALVDLASPEIHPKAKVAKDVAAAAVLLAALSAGLIGMLLFIPKIFYFFN